MTESEHDSLMDKVQNTEVRKGSQHACSSECACRDPNHLFISLTPTIYFPTPSIFLPTGRYDACAIFEAAIRGLETTKVMM